MEKERTEFKPVNLWVAIPVIMQIAIAAMMLWGWFGHAWSHSWVCAYAGVILCMELFFYNAAVKSGKSPIKALYPIIIMLGFGFFFLFGFAVEGGWSFSWWGLVAAAIGVLVTLCVDKAVSKK